MVGMRKVSEVSGLSKELCFTEVFSPHVDGGKGEERKHITVSDQLMSLFWLKVNPA